MSGLRARFEIGAAFDGVHAALSTGPLAPAGAKAVKKKSESGGLASSPLYLLLRDAATSDRHAKAIEPRPRDEDGDSQFCFSHSTFRRRRGMRLLFFLSSRNPFHSFFSFCRRVYCSRCPGEEEDKQPARGAAQRQPHVSHSHRGSQPRARHWPAISDSRHCGLLVSLSVLFRGVQSRGPRLRYRMTGALGGRVLLTPSGVIPPELMKARGLQQQKHEEEEEEE